MPSFENQGLDRINNKQFRKPLRDTVGPAHNDSHGGRNSDRYSQIIVTPSSAKADKATSEQVLGLQNWQLRYPKGVISDIA